MPNDTQAFDTEKLQEVACKIHEFSPSWSLEAKENYVKHALRENSVHKRLEHPNIVKLYNTV
jgi:tousled-like kinase